VTHAYNAGIVRFVIALVAIWPPGCVARQIGRPVPLSGVQEADLEGVWDGISVNDCTPVQVDPSRCRGVERITFTLLRKSKKVSGFYRCAAGTVPCYNFVESGIIRNLRFDGHRLSFRVMREDGSSCLFNTIPVSDSMTGGFLCLQGDAFVERGFWQVHHAY
jgi:hypothetical protein